MDGREHDTDQGYDHQHYIEQAHHHLVGIALELIEGDRADHKECRVQQHKARPQQVVKNVFDDPSHINAESNPSIPSE